LNRKILVVGSSIVLALCIMLLGCEAKEPAPPPTAPTGSFLEGMCIKDNGEPLDVHYLANFLFVDWPVVNSQLAKSLIERAGGRCTIHDSNMDQPTELATVQDLVSAGKVDVFISHCSDIHGIIPATEHAVDAGVDWYAVDMLNGSPKITGYIGVRGQPSLGRPAAEAMVEYFDGQPFTVLEIWGSLGMGICEGRHEGIMDAMAGHDEITMLETGETGFEIEKVMNEVVDAFQAHPDIDAIIYQSAGMEGIWRALEQIDRLVPAGKSGHIAVFGVDATPIELDYVRDGYLDAVTEHHAGLVAELAVKVMIAHSVLGEETPKEVTFLPKLVTKENVDDPANFGNLPRENWDEWPVMDPDDGWFPTPHR